MLQLEYSCNSYKILITFIFFRLSNVLPQFRRPRFSSFCSGIRYVELSSSNEYLQIAQLAVYNTSGNNVAYKKPTISSEVNTVRRCPYSSSGAVDGQMIPKHFDDCNFSSYLSRSNSRPYWRVDLGKTYSLSNVIYYNREDSFSDRAKEYSIVFYSNKMEEVNCITNSFSSDMVQILLGETKRIDYDSGNHNKMSSNISYNGKPLHSMIEKIEFERLLNKKNKVSYFKLDDVAEEMQKIIIIPSQNLARKIPYSKDTIRSFLVTPKSFNIKKIYSSFSSMPYQPSLENEATNISYLEQPTGIPSATPTAIPSISQIDAHLSVGHNIASIQHISEQKTTDSPTGQPSSQPSEQPSTYPTSLPTVYQPSRNPSHLITLTPTKVPSMILSTQPTDAPSSLPTGTPSIQQIKYFYPTVIPSFTPAFPSSKRPTVSPSEQMPTGQPTDMPSEQPSSYPTSLPTVEQFATPSARYHPSVIPTITPSHTPMSLAPSVPAPTISPSSRPTVSPTRVVSNPFISTSSPSFMPVFPISITPTNIPTVIQNPTLLPSTVPVALISIAPSQSSVYSRSPSPTNQKPNYNTILPTLRPFRISTFKPSQSPVTFHPSFTPSFIPTVNPTEFGMTNPPTAIPSPGPSWNLLDYKNKRIYSTEYYPLVNFTTGHNTNRIFSSFVYKGHTKEGSCTDWKSFASSSLNLVVKSYYFSSIFFAFGFENFGSDSHSHRNISVVCSDTQRISSILATIRFKALSPLFPDSTVSCSGSIWKVLTCNSLPVVCVNCTGSCGCPGLSTITTTPCSGNCIANTASYSHLVFGVEQQILYPRLTIRDSISDRTTITIIANISAIGRLYCWAAPQNTTLTSPLAVKQYGSKSLVLDPSLNTTVKVSSLSPSTMYDLHCYTEDFAGNGMDLSSVRSTLRKISTTCCARIDFTTTYSNIGEYISNYTTADKNIFYLSLEKTPSIDIQIVDIAVNSVHCSNNDKLSNGSAVAIPSHFTFNKGTRVLSQGFVVHGSSGCYDIKASGKGLQSALISLVIYNISTTVNPAISGASFSPDGSSVKISFDSATNYGKGKILHYSTGFPCSYLLVFTGASAFTCKWMSDSLVMAYLASKSIYTPTTGDAIQLIPGVIGPNCVSNICATSSSSLTITPPSTLIAPTASLSAPSEVSACSDVTLDPTASKGYGLRDWSVVKWYVSSSDFDASQVSCYLNDFYNSTSSTVTVPNELLNPGTITFSLYVRNFLGGDSYATATVIVSDSTDIPYTIISGPATINIYRWQTLTLFAVAASSQCLEGPNATASTELSYSWKIYEGISYLSSPTSQSLNPRYFRLPSYSLTPMAQYTVQVTTISPLTGSFSSASVVVYVRRSGVVAVIAGGSKRVVSSFSSFVLDATPSYDQDYPNDPLTYNWTCNAIYPIYGASCNIVLNSNASIIIAAGALPVATYNFTAVVVSGAGAIGTASTVIVVVKRYLAAATFRSLKAKYSPEDRIIVGATVMGTDSLRTEWTCPGCGLNLSSITLTPLTSYFTAGVYAIQIAIKPYSFQSHQSYTLQLTCSYSDSTSYVQAVLKINAPPYQGQLAVVPVNGHTLSTSFFLNTYGWIDDASDYPISYVLEYYIKDAAEAQLLKSSGELQYARAYIGQGLSTNNYTVTCVATASDIYGCSNSALTKITVLPPSSKEALQSTMTALLTAASQTFNTDLIMQVIGATTTSLNMATCSNAPLCESFNRSSCDTVIDTCGPCLPGFLGIAGYVNSGCRLPQLLLKTGDSCRSSAECISNVCKYGTCISTLKSCSNNCSHNGVCQYFDSNSNQLEVCDANSYFCKAKCRCNTERFGADCSLTYLDFDTNKDMREEMCIHLYDVLETQDVSSDVFIGRAALLSSLLIDLTQITDGALSNCTLALTSTILQNPNLCATDLVYEKVVNALSRVVESGKLLPVLLSTQISLAIDKIMLERQKLIAVREITTVVTDNLRLYSTVAYNTELSSLLNVLPQTPIEIFNKVDSAKVLIGSNTTDSSSFVRISLAQSNINYRNASTDASRIKVLVMQDRPAASTTATIYMQNNRVMKYFKTPPHNSTVTCAIADYAYNISANCSTDPSLLVHCPGNTAGSIHIRCPTSQYIPHCLAWNGATYTQDPACRRVTYSPLNTSCVCDGSAVYQARRMLGSAGNGASGVVGEFSASAMVEVNAFKTTWESAANLNGESITNNYIIVTVVSVLFGFFLLGFGKLLRSQVKASEDKSVYSGQGQGEIFTKKKLSLKDGFEFFDSILPQEFKFRPWYSNFWIKLLECHPYLAFFAPARGRRLYHTKKWLGFCFELLMFVFLDSIFSPLAAPDPSTCAAYSRKTECLQPVSFDLVSTLCVWDDMRNTCLLNPPQNSFLVIIIVVLLVSVCSTPFDYLISYLIEKATSRTINEIELEDVINKDPIKIVDDSKAPSSGKFSLIRSLSLTGANRESLEFQADASNSSTQENVSNERASDINAGDISRNRNFNYFPSLVRSPRSAARKQSDFFQMISLEERAEKKASESRPKPIEEKKPTRRNIITSNTLAAAQIVINKKVMSLAIRSPEGSMSSETEEDLDDRAGEKADIYHDLISLEALRKVNSTRIRPPVAAAAEPGSQLKMNINVIKSRKPRNTCLMTTRSKMMLGARLVLLQQQIDNVAPEEELNLLLLEAEGMYKTDLMEGAISTIKSLQSIASHIDSADANAKTSNMHIKALRESLLIRLRRARVRAQAMIEELGMIDSEEEQEKILFKAFLVELSQNVQRKVLFQHLFELSSEEDETAVHWLVRIACASVMAMFFIGALFYVMLTGISLGQDVTVLWLQVLGIGILQDIVLLKPLGIWFRFIAIAGLVSESVRNVTDLIHDRVPAIMRRTRGVVRHSSLFVQHFNAACRAARAFPQLQTARLLIALNDYDLPRSYPKQRRVLHMIIDVLFYFFVLLILLITFFPEVFQDVIIEACMSAFINFPIYAMTILADVNVVIPLIIIIVLLAGCVARECLLRRPMYKLKKKERMSSIIAYDYQISSI